MKDLIDALGRALGVTPRIDPRPEQPGDVRVTYADISRARTDLGYDPQVDLEEGLARFVAWYRRQR